MVVNGAMNDSDEDRTKFGWIVQGMATSTSAIRAATRTGEDGRAQGMKRKKMREEKEGEYQRSNRRRDGRANQLG